MNQRNLAERAQAAQRLVEQLFSPAASPIRGIEYALLYRFGSYVGGDVADVFDCGSDGVFVSLADIEGNGQDAAVHAALVKYGVRAYACAAHEPARVLQYLNALYQRNCAAEGIQSFASLFLGVVERDRRSMRYVCAGYESAMLVHPNGFCELLRASGPILGVLDGSQAQFHERSIELPPGCVLVAVSDGITDARFGNKCFGLSRVRHMASERAHDSLNELAHSILDGASAFCRGDRRHGGAGSTFHCRWLIDAEWHE